MWTLVAATVWLLLCGLFMGIIADRMSPDGTVDDAVASRAAS